MNHKKQILIWPMLYIALMGVFNAIARFGFHVNYGEPPYVKTMLPFLVV